MKTDLIHVTGRAQRGKISKVGAGYVHRENTNYRCIDCVNFLAARKRCALFGKDDEVLLDEYCIYWAFGKRPDDDDADDQPQGCYTPKEAGLGSLKDGTKCSRCRHFNGKDDCELVDRDSTGDDPGKIDESACCSNQQPGK